MVVATAKRCPLAEEASRLAVAATRKISSKSEEFFEVAKVLLIKAWIIMRLESKGKLSTIINMHL